MLGSVGFSRGIHYWEFAIDTYTADTDPAFGIARVDVARDQMLGKNVSLNFVLLIKFFSFSIVSFRLFCVFR